MYLLFHANNRLMITRLFYKYCNDYDIIFSLLHRIFDFQLLYHKKINIINHYIKTNYKVIYYRNYHKNYYDKFCNNYYDDTIRKQYLYEKYCLPTTHSILSNYYFFQYYLICTNYYQNDLNDYGYSNNHPLIIHSKKKKKEICKNFEMINYFNYNECFQECPQGYLYNDYN